MLVSRSHLFNPLLSSQSHLSAFYSSTSDFASFHPILSVYYSSSFTFFISLKNPLYPHDALVWIAVLKLQSVDLEPYFVTQWWESTHTLRLPGFGRSINQYECDIELVRRCFSQHPQLVGGPHNVIVILSLGQVSQRFYCTLELTTLNEFMMFHILNYITDKPD